MKAYARRRCIVPVDGFFEWRAIRGARAKQPYAIAMKAPSLAPAFLLFAKNNFASAQETPPPDRPLTTTADDRDDVDWGWLGLIGLAGLAGLMRRRDRDGRVRTTTTRA